LGGVRVGFLTILGAGVGVRLFVRLRLRMYNRIILHHTLRLGIPFEIVQFLLELLLKQRFIAVYHDFH